MSEPKVPPGSELPSLPQPPPPVPYRRVSGHRPPPTGVPWSAPLPVADDPPRSAGVFAPSFFRAVLCGSGGAVVGAAIWYALVVFSDRQFLYVAVGLGVVVGYSVGWGAARGGVMQAVLSAVIASLAIVGAFYYINRHLIIASGEELGISYDIPLIPTFDELKIVLRVGYEADSSQYVFSGLCVAAAAFFGFKGTGIPR